MSGLSNIDGFSYIYFHANEDIEMPCKHIYQVDYNPYILNYLWWQILRFDYIVINIFKRTICSS